MNSSARRAGSGCNPENGNSSEQVSNKGTLRKSHQHEANNIQSKSVPSTSNQTNPTRTPMAATEQLGFAPKSLREFRLRAPRNHSIPLAARYAQTRQPAGNFSRGRNPRVWEATWKMSFLLKGPPARSYVSGSEGNRIYQAKQKDHGFLRGYIQVQLLQGDPQDEQEWKRWGV